MSRQDNSGIIILVAFGIAVAIALIILLGKILVIVGAIGIIAGIVLVIVGFNQEHNPLIIGGFLVFAVAGISLGVGLGIDHFFEDTSIGNTLRDSSETIINATTNAVDAVAGVKEAEADAVRSTQNN